MQLPHTSKHITGVGVCNDGQMSCPAFGKKDNLVEEISNFFIDFIDFKL